MKKTYQVTAHETIIHAWEVEAETLADAEQLARNGCPRPDGDCESSDFDIRSVRLARGSHRDFLCWCGVANHNVKDPKKMKKTILLTHDAGLTFSQVTIKEKP